MEEKILILSVNKPYSFTPEGSSDVMEGCTMYYLSADKNLKPVETDNGLGYLPLKEKMPVDFYERIKSIGVPCEAKVHYVMRVSNGKNVLKIDGIDFLK